MRLSYSREIDVDATAQFSSFDWKLAGETEATTTVHVNALPTTGSENWVLQGSLDGVTYFPLQVVNLKADPVSQAPLGGSGLALTMTHGPWPFMQLYVLQTTSNESTTLKVWSHG